MTQITQRLDRNDFPSFGVCHSSSSGSWEPGPRVACRSYPLILFLCFSTLESAPRPLPAGPSAVSPSVSLCLCRSCRRPWRCYKASVTVLIFAIFRGVGIDVSFGNGNPRSEAEAGPRPSVRPSRRGCRGPGPSCSDRGSSWNVKMFRFPKASDPEPLCVLWPRFKNLVDC